MGDYSEIKAQLEERLADLRDRAERVDARLKQKGQSDWDDAAVEAEGNEVLDAIGNAALAEIEKLEKSIAAIEGGTYGVCTSCGGRILAERLAVLPEATKCARCA